jgi:pimeloyl-ACP methyl ester carboxylesterase
MAEPVALTCTERSTGDPVVLLHAFPLSSAMWGASAALLADRWRVLTPDLRGFGASPLPPDDEPSLDAMADDVVALLDRSGLQRPVVGGVSMGGYVVLALLRRHPERVGAALLVDTKAAADAPEARARRLATAEALERSGTAEPLLASVDGLLGATTRMRRPEVVAQVRSWVSDAPPAAAAWAQRAMAARLDAAPTLAATDVPVAVLVGEEDELTPHEQALATAAATEDRETIVWVIPEAGHLAVVEQPERAASVIADALRHLARR